MKHINITVDNTYLDNDCEERRRQPIAFAALIVALLVGTLTAIVASTSGYSLIMSILYFSLSGQAAFVAFLVLALLVEGLKNSWGNRKRIFRRMQDKWPSEIK